MNNMTMRRDFDLIFKPETFSFRNSRDLEEVYSFYLKKLTSRSVKANYNPKTILTPHDFAVHLSLEIHEEKQPNDFYAGEKLYVDLYDFILYVSNPKQVISTERLTKEDQQIYNTVFQENVFADELRPADLERELDKVKKEFESILSIRELQAAKWERLIQKMLNQVQERIKKAFTATVYVDDQVLYVLPNEIAPYTVDDLRRAELEQVKIEGKNHVVLNMNVNADKLADTQYIQELVDLYGEDLTKNIIYVDEYGNRI